MHLQPSIDALAGYSRRCLNSLVCVQHGLLPHESGMCAKRTFPPNVCIYITVYDLHTRTHILSTGHKHECPAHEMCYTYQILTAKPVFIADKTVSLMELIAAGHAVAVPHDAGVRSQIPFPLYTSGQALCGMTRVTGH